MEYIVYALTCSSKLPLPSLGRVAEYNSSVSMRAIVLSQSLHLVPQHTSLTLMLDTVNMIHIS